MQQYAILSQRELHSQLPEGEESDWNVFTELVIVSGKIAISDPMFFRDLPPPPTFDFEYGIYSVAVKFVTYPDSEIRVSRMRVLKGEIAEMGIQLDEVGVDFGQVGIFDPILLDILSERMTQEKAETVFAEIDMTKLYGVAHFNDDIATMPFAGSGFGDGGYPIFELIRDDQLVGLEIVFIGDELFDESPSRATAAEETDPDSEMI